jgi:uncharacterized membrane protein YphA (DoxX/SURF4 family)
MLNWVVGFSRWFVGLLFIFSGLIKLNDPMGLSFKLHDYFAPDVLNLPVLDPYTLPLALAVILLEIVLGVMLIVGTWPRLTTALLLGMILFFSFLTFYSAYFNKVTDCGCFGDAIPLTPWESFYKDLVLLVLILILFGFRNQLQPLTKPENQRKWVLGTLVLSGILAYVVLTHLPFKDFRPYAVGKSIPEGMKSAEELGLEPPKYLTIYTLANGAGEQTEVDSERYVAEKWWEKSEWAIVDDLTRTIKVSEGYEPPIHDFVLSNDTADLTTPILEMPQVALVVAYRLEKGSPEGFEHLTDWAQKQDPNLKIYLVTASLPEVIAEHQAQYNHGLEVLSGDETTLKTMIRSNPGLIVLQKGTVVGQWAWRDFPSAENLQKAFP